MPKAVKIVLVLALLLGGADAARDYFLVSNPGESVGRTGEIINFWGFVAVTVALLAYLAYRRFRPHR